MITLLLALFIVLFALSSVNKAKFEEFKAGIKTAFVGNGGGLSPAAAGLLSAQVGVQVPHPLTNPVHGPSGPQAALPVSVHFQTKPTAPSPTSTTVPTIVPTTVPGTIPPDTSQLAVLEKEIEATLAAQGLIQDVVINLSPNQLSVELLADKVFFATNSNALSDVGKEIVDTVGGTVAPYSNDILVKGYADNVPVKGGPWYSNFMLSAARATAVVLRLTHADGVSEDRLIAEGFGSTHPVASNSTAAGRAQNRRVDIDILAERS
jgi:chemotaxis protein MotB